MMELRVKAVEGLAENLSSVGCYLTIENELIDVISPLSFPSSEKPVRIPTSGRVRLILKNLRESEKRIVSVSFFADLLPADTLWLPLFETLENDFIEALPASVVLPRLQVQRSVLAQPVNFLDKIKSLQLKIVDLEHTLASERWEFQREIDSLSSSQRYREDAQALVIEQLKAQVEKQDAVILELMGRNSEKNMGNCEDSQWQTRINGQVRELQEKYSEFVKMSQGKDEQLLQHISVLGNEVGSLRDKSEVMQADLEEKDMVISRLANKIKGMTGGIGEGKRGEEGLERVLHKRLEEPKKMIRGINKTEKTDKKKGKKSENIEKLKIRKNEAVLLESPSSDSDLSSKIMQLMVENRLLKAQLSKFENGLDETDEALQPYGEAFSKLATGLYSYQNTKLSIFLENGNLMCRTGNPIPLGEFVLSITNASYSTSCEISFKESNRNEPEAIFETDMMSNKSGTGEKKEGKTEGKDKTQKGIRQFRPDNKVYVPIRQAYSQLRRRLTK
jgi:hypothetical protein